MDCRVWRRGYSIYAGGDARCADTRSWRACLRCLVGRCPSFCQSMEAKRRMMRRAEYAARAPRCLRVATLRWPAQACRARLFARPRQRSVPDQAYLTGPVSSAACSSGGWTERPDICIEINLMPDELGTALGTLWPRQRIPIRDSSSPEHSSSKHDVERSENVDEGDKPQKAIRKRHARRQCGKLVHLSFDQHAEDGYRGR